jgi:hypothetical protein
MRAAKQPEPTAGSIDAQSAKTTKKRGLQEITAMTLAKKLKVVSDTYWLIRSASY